MELNIVVALKIPKGFNITDSFFVLSCKTPYRSIGDSVYHCGFKKYHNRHHTITIPLEFGTDLPWIREEYCGAVLIIGVIRCWLANTSFFLLRCRCLYSGGFSWRWHFLHYNQFARNISCLVFAWSCFLHPRRCLFSRRWHCYWCQLCWHCWQRRHRCCQFVRCPPLIHVVLHLRDGCISSFWGRLGSTKKIFVWHMC